MSKAKFFSYRDEKYHQKNEGFYKLFSYTPHSGQRKFHESNAKVRIACCAARWGKSLAGGYEAAKALTILGCKVALYAPTYSLAKRGEWAWLLEMLQKSGLLQRATKFTDPSVGESNIQFPWQAELRVRSCDNKKSLLGEEVDVAILCEAAQMNREHLERYIIPRVTARRGHLVFLSTPAGKGTWYEEYFNKGQDSKIRDWESWQFGLAGEYGNPYFPQEQVEWARENTSKEFFEENYLGLFTTRKGAVYKEFSEENLIDRMPEGWRAWPIVIGLDFGYRNPTAAIFIAVDTSGPNYYIFDEIYQSELLTMDLGALIIKKRRGLRNIGVVADHDANARGILKQLGISTIKCMKNEREKLKEGGSRRGLLLGIETVTRLVKKPNLFIMRKCVNTIKEFRLYSWPPDRGEETGNAEQDYPLDQYSHAMDAVRYALYWCEKRFLQKRNREHEQEKGYLAPKFSGILEATEKVKFSRGTYKIE